MRIEEDIIGKLEIKDDVLYGIHTLRTVNNMSFSGKVLKQYPTLINSLAIVKKAAAKANLEAGLITEEVQSAISTSCDQIIAGEYYEQFIVDVFHGGGGIGFNMNANEVICNLANDKLGHSKGQYYPIHPIEHVNASQSTSDVCHTGMRMAIIMSFYSLTPIIDTLISALEEKAEDFQHITTISRTCLQDGMQTPMREFFSAFAIVIKRRMRNLENVIDQLYEINLGGTVIGSGIGATAKYREIIIEKLCEESNLHLRQRENLFDAARNMDDLVQVSSELRILATCLIKFAKDLRLLSSGPEAGFGEIQLPSVQAGSSFFPGKINPVIPETLIQSGFQVIACDRAVQAALEHGELDLNVFESSAGINILDSLTMLKKSISIFTENCVKGILVNRDRCREISNSLIPVVVELKEKLGYSAVAELLKVKSKEEIKQLLQSEDDLK